MNDVGFLLIIAGISVILGLFVGLLIGQFRKPKIGIDEKEQVFKSVVEIGRSPKSEAFIVQVGNKLYQEYEFLRENDRETLIDTNNKLQTWMGLLPEEMSPVEELELVPEPVEAIDSDFELEEETIEEPELVTEVEAIPEPVLETVEAFELDDEPVLEPEQELVQETDLEDDQVTPDWLPADIRESEEEPRESPLAGGINPFDMVVKAVQADVGKPELEPKSIVEEIDDVLQEKIAGTHLADKGVRLMELPDQGLVVMVGMEKFGKVDDVDDPEVKAAIQDAVSTWEEQASSEE